MEVVISLTALRKGYMRIVQTTLLGSVFSNMLLVLGTCFLVGGLTHREQRFNKIGAKTYSSLLLMASLGLVSPAAFAACVQPKPSKQDVLTLSHLSAVVLGLLYCGYLFFQMKTHAEIYASVEEEDPELIELSLAASVTLLTCITVLVVTCTQFLIDSIQGAINTLQINQVFIGIILLPIIGNAAEHVSAVTVALKNKMDLALAIAIGSSIQISLFVIPLVTIVGWISGQPLSLDFHFFETVILVVSVLVVNVIIGDGRSHWLAGAMLLAAYLIIAVSFFFHPISALRTNYGQ